MYMYIDHHDVQCTCIYIDLFTPSQAIEAAVTALRSHTLNLNPIVDSNIIKIPIPK